MAIKQYLDYEGLKRLIENIDKKYAPIAALLFKGSVENIEALPALANQKVGWMYNIEIGGGTTEDFIEGPGHVVADGENVACVELITGYTAVAAPTATDDPKALGWYEQVSVDNYVLSEDRIANLAKTYYTANTVKKWDILGGVFDLENKYLELGEEFPQGPASRMVDGRTFLYLGTDKNVYVAVADPTGRPKDNGYFEGTFTEVADPSTIVNPSQEPLYVVDTDVAAKYVATTPVANPQAEGLYEEDGAGGYQLTADTTIDSSKTYYAKVDTYKRTTDQTVQDGTTYFTGAFVASVDTIVDTNKVYYTESALYKKGGIYIYNATTHEWTAQSGGGAGDIAPITNAEIDDLFI